MRCSISIVALVSTLFLLPLSAQVTGTIIGEEGAAISGVHVRAYAIESSTDTAARVRSESPRRTPLAETETDDDGHFALKVDGHDVVDLAFSQDGSAPFGLVARSSGEVGAFILRPAKMTSGTVTRGGDAVAGAVILWSNGIAEYLAVADGAGRYEVPDPSVWKPSFEVHSESSFQRWSRDPAPLPYRKPDLDIRISANKIAGVVVEGDETPVPDAALLVDGVSLGKTDADGKFELEVSPSWKSLVAISGERIGSVRRGAARLMVKLAAGAQLRGRVIDGRGRGIPEARVVLTNAVRGYRGEQSVSIVTAADGAFASGIVVPGKYQLTVARPGYSSGMAQIDGLAGVVAKKDIPLSLAATVEGTVRDEERHPVAAALAGAENYSPLAQQGAATGPDGRYVLLDVPGSVKSKVWVVRPGYPDGSSESFVTQPGKHVTGIDVTMTNGYEVTGRLIDERGEPVAGVRVGSTDKDYLLEMLFVEYPGFTPAEFPLSDREGNFTTRVGKGTWFFAFRAPGFAVRITEGRKVDGPMSLGEIVMETGGELSGRVVRESGAAVEDAGVGLRESDSRFNIVTTDSEGRFSFHDLPRRKINVMVTKGDGSRAEKRIEVPATDVVFELPDVVTVRGRVVDADTNKPVPDFMLGITQSSQVGGSGKSPYHSSDGSFELETVPTEGLALAASAAGYTETRKLVTIGEGDAEPIELALTRGVRVGGTVSDASGRPMEGVTVGYDKSVEMGSGGTMRMREAQVTTDATGTYSFDSVAAGTAQFGFTKQGYLRIDRTIEATGPENRLDVEMSNGVSVRGIVVDETGLPVANARVYASTSGTARSYASGESGTDGRFVVEPLAPGKGRVVAEAPGFARASVEEVDIGSATEVRVVMEVGAIVEGRIIGIDPDEMQNVILRIGEGPSFERRVNSSGEFRIEGVKAGHVVMVASAKLPTGYRSSNRVEEELAAGQVARVELEFVEGNTLRGVVTIGDKPLGDASILFRAKDGQASGVHAIADDQGRYEASGLADGEYLVTVQEFSSRRFFETSYEMRGSGDFDIHLEEGSVEGRVVDAGTGNPIEGATVAVELGEHSSVSMMSSSAVTDSEGRFIILASNKGELRVIARKKGYGAVVRQVGGAETSGIEIEMQQATGVRLRVTDARDGQPLTPSVTVEDVSGRPISTESFSSAPEGVVTIDLAPGQYRLLVWSRGYAWRPVRVSVPSGEIGVALTPGGKLALRAPVDHPVRVTIRDSEDAVVRRWPGDTNRTMLVSGRTTIPALAPGDYSVEASPAAGGQTRVHKVRVVEGGTAELNLE